MMKQTLFATFFLLIIPGIIGCFEHKKLDQSVCSSVKIARLIKEIMPCPMQGQVHVVDEEKPLQFYYFDNEVFFSEECNVCNQQYDLRYKIAHFDQHNICRRGSCIREFTNKNALKKHIVLAHWRKENSTDQVECYMCRALVSKKDIAEHCQTQHEPLADEWRGRSKRSKSSD